MLLTNVEEPTAEGEGESETGQVIKGLKADTVIMVLTSVVENLGFLVDEETMVQKGDEEKQEQTVGEVKMVQTYDAGVVGSASGPKKCLLGHQTDGGR